MKSYYRCNRCKLSSEQVDTEISSAQHAMGCPHEMWELLLAELAGVPWTCSPKFLKDSNGYFHCEITRDSSEAIKSIGKFNMSLCIAMLRELILHSNLVTRSLFEAKQLEMGGRAYHWIRFSLVTSWLASDDQTRLFILEAPPGFTTTLSNWISEGLRRNELGDPFWAVEKIVNSVVDACDRTVWAVRDQVRRIEMVQMPSDRKPSPDYREMHDLARHAIHVSESLTVSLETVGSIIRSHDNLLRARTDRVSVREGKMIHSRLLFMENILHNLRSRSDSNQQRLLNEIQLAFHAVAQYDSKISIEVTQSDGIAMRTVACVTLIALPATFVSSIFSMSFFNFNSDGDSKFISDNFWIFWAITIPLTISASVFCNYFHIVPSFGLRRREPI